MTSNIIENLIKEIEEISNFPKKIDLLLKDESIEVLKGTDYIYELYNNSNSSRKSVFHTHPNFYKALTPGDLYSCLQNETNTKLILELLNAPNILETITKTNLIINILETTNKENLKELLLNDKVFYALNYENCTKFYLLFIEDEEIRNFILNQSINKKLKEKFINNDLINEKLTDEELFYLLLNGNYELIVKLLRKTTTYQMLIKDNMLIIDLFNNYDEKLRLILLKNQIYSHLIFNKFDEIYNTLSVKETNLIFENKELLKKLDGETINYFLAKYPKKLKQYLENEELTNLIEQKCIKYQIKAITLYKPNIKKNLIIHYFFSKNIIKRLSSDDLAYAINSLSENEKIEVIKEIFKFNKISIYKIALVINKLILNNDQKQIIFYELYNKNLQEVIIEADKKVTKYLKNFCSNDLLEELKEDIKDNILGKEINILKIYDELKSCPYMILSKNYFEIFITLFANQKLKEKHIDVEVVTEILTKKNCGLYRQNKVLVNSLYIKETLFENIETFKTITHEFTHYIQEDNYQRLIYDYDTLKQVKDEILKDRVRNYYKIYRNYFVSNYECEAFLEEIKIKYKLLKEFNCLEEKDVKKLVQLTKKTVNLKNQTDRIGKKFKTYSLNYYFDKAVKPIEIPMFLKEYPILSLEYNSDGSKKTLIDLIESFVEAKRNLLKEKNESNVQRFVFYKKILDDKMYKNQRHISKEEYLLLLKEIKVLIYYKSNDLIFNEKKEEIIKYVNEIIPNPVRIYRKKR